MRLQQKRVPEALFRGGAFLHRLLAYAAVVPDFRRRPWRSRNEAIVQLKRFAVARLREQQIRKIAERRDFGRTPRQRLAIAALGAGALADRVEL